MSHQEKRTWIFAGVTILTAGYYFIWLIIQAQTIPFTTIAYIPTMLWVIAAATVLVTLAETIVATITPKESKKKDQRDQEIYQYGEYIGHSFVIIGAIGALILSILKVDHFWIANSIYIAFVLSALVSSMAKLAAYRTGF